MYIDFHKYNYDLVPEDQKKAFIDRDQIAYKASLQKWLIDNLDEMVHRKWEIEEIQYLSNVSDFVKLIREGEQLYELGFYTSCIALIGICSEDFLRYLAVQLGKPQYESLSQFERTNKLLNDGLISQQTHDLLHDIRNIRNDCLHYNQNFKQKNVSDLKVDALAVLNKLKGVLKDIIGVSKTSSGIQQIISNISTGDDSRNTEEVVVKLKNAVSHILNLPIAFPPGHNYEIRTVLLEILDIDEDELGAQDLSNGMRFFIEFPDDVQKNYQFLNLKQGDKIIATITSIIDINGLTAEWNVLNMVKT